MTAINHIRAAENTAVADNAECATLLKEANTLYQQMVQLLEKMNSTGQDRTPQQYQAAYADFSRLQQQIESHDIQLNSSLRRTSTVPDDLRGLLDVRRSLIETLLTMNSSLTRRAQSIKSLAADEIRKCSTGHTALRGYKSQEQPQRKSLLKKAM